MLDNNFICDTVKYTFNEQTIAVGVNLKNLPKSIEVDDIQLILKSEFHVSLVCIGKIIEKHNIQITDFENPCDSLYIAVRYGYFFN